MPGTQTLDGALGAPGGSLNPEQMAAVRAADGPILVLAGPGSGKTRVLTARVAHLIAQGVPPWKILAVTFTNKAAREMRRRLGSRLGEDVLGKLTIGTFHGFCARLLRQEADRAGITPNYVIYDTADQRRVVRRALEDLELDHTQHRPAAILATISRAKNELLGPGDFVPHSYPEEIAARVYPRYQTLLRQCNALDFDDLLLEVAQLLRGDVTVRRRLQERYAHVLVDEFQDTNMAQYDIVKHLAAAETPAAPHNLFVVGDEDQSIYSWRGADWRNLDRFRRDFPGASTVLLQQNYRSTQNILDAARAVIDRNRSRTPKRLWTAAPAGAPVVVFEAYNEAEEAAYVVQEIRHMAEKSGRFGDAAVMYRTNAQSRSVEDALVRSRIPYTIVGATRFYQRREVKDLLAYLQIVHNPRDDFALDRVINVPPRGIGPKAYATLAAWAQAGGAGRWAALEALAAGSPPPGAPVPAPRTRRALLAFRDAVAEVIEARERLPLPDLLSMLLARTGYAAWLRDGSEEGEDRWANVSELRGVAQDFAALPPREALAAFLEAAALVADVDNLEERPDRVTLLTLHSAKGLEFPTVFLVGLEEGLLPHSRSTDDPVALAEERRLFYVGLTRAKERVVIVHAFRRSAFGSAGMRQPSRFLADLPAEVMNRAGSTAAGKGRPRRSRQAEWAAPEDPPAAGFKPGDKVRHETFGEGTVVACATLDGDQEVTVAFAGAGLKKLVASYAHLEPAG